MSLFEKAKNHCKAALPFVLYCKPNTDEVIGIFQKNANLYLLNDYAEKGFAFVSFTTEEKVFLPIAQSEIITEKKSSFPPETKTITHHFSIETKISYEQLVTKTVGFIKQGNCQKVVTSRREEVALLHFSELATFKKLLALYPTAFCYCFYHPKIGMWLGATPEQLLKVEDNFVKTVALAGTKKASETAENWGKKEQIEQQLVTDFIVKNVSKFVENLTITKPYTYKAGTLLHIKTDISAILTYKNQLKNIIEALHPTPAVCGFPKEIAKDFIIQNEGYNREFYAGFLGELNFSSNNNSTNNSDLFVNLRCMKVENSVANIYVGGGITADSIAENEFFETVNKSETIKKVL
ncbi:chorismate-binding protein [Flavobacterium sp.]|uniref:chorismate-binding protein n=1 Tax=Flavobacterium sp. TaxID=239 RepID=UPI003529C030